MSGPAYALAGAKGKMKVRLKTGRIEDLSPEILAALHDVELLKATGYSGGFAPIGTEFVVYGIEIHQGNVVYQLGNPPLENDVIQGLATLFDIVDGRVSQYWQARVLPNGSFVLWPASWFAEFYHDRLSDGESAICEDFTRLRELMTNEFHDAATNAVA